MRLQTCPSHEQTARHFEVTHSNTSEFRFTGFPLGSTAIDSQLPHVLSNVNALKFCNLPQDALICKKSESPADSN